MVQNVMSIEITQYPWILGICDENLLDFLDILCGLSSLFLCYQMISVYILFAESGLKATVYEISQCFQLVLMAVGVCMILLSFVLVAVIMFISAQEAEQIANCILFYLFINVDYFDKIFVSWSDFTIQNNLLESQASDAI